MKKAISAVIVTILFTSKAAMAIDCGPLRIAAIQSQTNNVLVLVDYLGTNIWKTLGSHSDTATKSYQSLIQQALATDSLVVLRFPDGIDCTAPDFSTSPLMVRILKD